MQDRFKFRFWDTKTENIITMNERLMYTGRNFNLDLGNMIYTSKRFVTMQSTGLKDKNGKLIYEGDIVKTRDGVLNKVFWENEYAQFLSQEIGGFEVCSDFMDYEDIEVIGNIYENPELLN